MWEVSANGWPNKHLCVRVLKQTNAHCTACQSVTLQVWRIWFVSGNMPWRLSWKHKDELGYCAAWWGKLPDHLVYFFVHCYCFSHTYKCIVLLALASAKAIIMGNYGSRCQSAAFCQVPQVSSSRSFQQRKMNEREQGSAIKCLLCQGTVEEGGKAKRSSFILHIRPEVINESLTPWAAKQHKRKA